MTHRLIAALLAALVAGCIVVPGAFAAGASSSATSSSTTKSALDMLSAIQSIHIGANSTTVTIMNGAKSHPIVIDYGAALKTGVLGDTSDGSSSKAVQSDAPVSSSPLPKSLNVGQIAAWLLGLTLVSRVVGIARQVVPRR